MDQLQQAVNTAMSNIVASGAIEKAIEKKLEETVTSIINDELKSYSDFGKGLHAQIKEALSINFKEFSLPSYNHMILKIVRGLVDDNINKQMAATLETQLTSLLSPAPAEITLTGLLGMFKEAYTEDYESRRGQRFTLFMEDHENANGIWWFHLDKHPDVSKHDCDIQFLVNDGVITHLSLEGRKANKTVFFGEGYSFHRALFQMFTAGTKLVIDDTDPETRFSEED